VTVLLWGLPHERPLAAVREALERRGTPVAMVDQHAILETELELSVGTEVEGRLRTPGQTIDLARAGALYLRPYEIGLLPSLAAAGAAEAAWRHAAAVTEGLWCFAELTRALVVNRPSAMAGAGNSSKPHQLTRIQAAGFLVPETLVTTHPEAAREFWRRHGSVVYKSISGVRSRVTRLGPAHRRRLGDVVWCPTQFQRRIAGTDHRVHVVGSEVFACAVDCNADDYRYASLQGSREPRFRAVRLPADVEERCLALAAGMGLHLAGIDLRRTPAGEWYCFEVNPSPAFTYYDGATGQRILAAVARLLAGAAT
jgi:hypothetical protein